MGADGVGNMADVDGGKELGLGGPLHKYLVVEIIAVVGDKDVDVSHDLKNVQTLTVSTTYLWRTGQHIGYQPALVFGWAAEALPSPSRTSAQQGFSCLRKSSSRGGTRLSDCRTSCPNNASHVL